MSLLRPGVVKQHKTKIKPCNLPRHSPDILCLLVWLDRSGKALISIVTMSLQVEQTVCAVLTHGDGSFVASFFAPCLQWLTRDFKD